LTDGRPLSRLGKVHASMTLLSLLYRLDCMASEISDMIYEVSFPIFNHLHYIVIRLPFYWRKAPFASIKSHPALTTQNVIGLYVDK